MNPPKRLQFSFSFFLIEMTTLSFLLMLALHNPNNCSVQCALPKVEGLIPVRNQSPLPTKFCRVPESVRFGPVVWPHGTCLCMSRVWGGRCRDLLVHVRDVRIVVLGRLVIQGLYAQLDSNHVLFLTNSGSTRKINFLLDHVPTHCVHLRK